MQSLKGRGRCRREKELRRFRRRAVAAAAAAHRPPKGRALKKALFVAVVLEAAVFIRDADAGSFLPRLVSAGEELRLEWTEPGREFAPQTVYGLRLLPGQLQLEFYRQSEEALSQ